jgi:hypothetical protein
MMANLQIQDMKTNIVLDSGAIGLEAAAVTGTMTIGDMSTNIGRTANGYIANVVDGTFAEYAKVGDFITNIPLDSNKKIITTADSGEDEKVVVGDILSDLGRKNGKIKISTGSSFFNFFGPTNTNGFTAVSSNTAYQDSVISVAGADMVCYYPLNESSGTDIIDLSGNMSNGTYTGITLEDTTSPSGTLCPLFDGVTSYGSLPTGELYGLLDEDEYSVSCWMKRVNSWAVTSYLWSFQSDSNTNNGSRLASQTSGSSVMTALCVRNSVNKFSIQAISGADTDFYHCLFTYSKTNNRLRWYEDGTLKATTTQTASWAGVACTTFIIGATISASSKLNGNLSDFCIFNREATAGEATTLATGA